MNTLSTRWAAIGSVVGLAGVLILTTLPSADDGTLAAIAAASTSFLLGNSLTFLGTALIGAGLLVIGHHCTPRPPGIRRPLADRRCRLVAPHGADRAQRGVVRAGAPARPRGRDRPRDADL